jgi:hypothetical protein
MPHYSLSLFGTRHEGREHNPSQRTRTTQPATLPRNGWTVQNVHQFADLFIAFHQPEALGGILSHTEIE